MTDMTDEDIPVARVLDAARQCASVLVLGEHVDGTFYCASSTGDGATLVWWMECFKHRLLSGDYG